METIVFVPPVFDELKSGWLSAKGTGRHQPPRAARRHITSGVAEAGVRAKQRSRHAPPFELTDRDAHVLRALHRLRVLDRQQIEQLFFPNFSLACKRLRLLYQHGFVERLYRPPYPNGAVRGPAYRLGTRGAKLLADEQGIALPQFFYWGKGDDRDAHQVSVNYLFLEHALQLSSVRISIEASARASKCTIEQWRDDVDIRRGKMGDEVRVEPSSGAKHVTMKVIPDGYIVLVTANGHTGHFFLEADRGSESVKEKWRRKIFGYKALFSSGTFHKRYQVQERQTAFRVLVTTPSLIRAQNLKAAAQRYGDARLSQLFLFAPISDVTTQDTLTAPIWLRGGTPEAQGLL
jgi:hypothetical protein